MERPFSVDKKYVDQYGVYYSYVGFHPTINPTHKFVFAKQHSHAIFCCDVNGNLLWSNNITLREVKPKITRWVNVYPDLVGYETKGKADSAASPRRVACVKVEFEEGEGL